MFGFQAEYLTDKILLRSEYGYVKYDGMEMVTDSAYLEAGYHITENWQVVGRFDWYEWNIASPLYEMFPSLSKHKEWALGLNYWFKPNMVVKASYHLTDGNLMVEVPDLISAVR